MSTVAYLCTPEGLGLHVRQITRWLRAARQDLDPGIRFLHASYGLGVLDILRQLASDANVIAAMGVDPRELHDDLVRLQDQAQAELARRLR